MNKENLKKASTFLLKTTILLLIFSIMTYVPVLADTKNTYAEKGAKWILDGIFWCVIVAGIFGAGTAAVKRNATAAIGIILGAILVCLFCKNPDLFNTIGTKLKAVLGL